MFNPPNYKLFLYNVRFNYTSDDRISIYQALVTKYNMYKKELLLWFVSLPNQKLLDLGLCLYFAIDFDRHTILIQTLNLNGDNQYGCINLLWRSYRMLGHTVGVQYSNFTNLHDIDMYTVDLIDAKEWSAIIHKDERLLKEVRHFNAIHGSKL